MGRPDVKMAELGDPYTLWVKYRMALQIGDCHLYRSNKDTTIVLEDIKRLIEELRKLVARGDNGRLAFDPIEPDFGLIISNLTESDAWVMISSAAAVRAGTPTWAAIRSAEPSRMFDVNVWIDHPNQVDRFYGGYGPGLYFPVEIQDIARFAEQLQAELDGLGSYFPGTNSN
ncbi:MAG: hypothetical protein WCJ37_18485 [Syntrophus sp. (in: bacteria)]